MKAVLVGLICGAMTFILIVVGYGAIEELSNQEPAEVIVDPCPVVLGKITKDCVPHKFQGFNSSGGSVGFGFRIINRGIETAIVQEYCNSMCIPMVITAKNRYACEGSLFLFHQASDVMADIAIQALIDQDPRIHSDTFRRLWNLAPHESYTVFTAHYLLTIGFLDEIVKCDKWAEI